LRQAGKARHGLRCHQLSGTEANAEQCKAAGQALTGPLLFAMMVLLHVVSQRFDNGRAHRAWWGRASNVRVQWPIR
jgi:hypothetical protein